MKKSNLQTCKHIHAKNQIKVQICNSNLKSAIITQQYTVEVTQKVSVYQLKSIKLELDLMQLNVIQKTVFKSSVGVRMAPSGLIRLMTMMNFPTVLSLVLLRKLLVKCGPEP